MHSQTGNVERTSVDGWDNLLKEIHNSPVHQLPNEILTEICTMCWENACSNPDGNNFSEPRLHIAFILSQVCSRWRSVSCSTPLLWSHVTILFPERKNSASMVRTFVNTCLERSQNKPLHITFDSPTTGDAHIPVLLDAVKHSRRWKTAVLRLGPDDLPNLPNSFPMLEGLVSEGQYFQCNRAWSRIPRRIFLPCIRTLTIIPPDSGLDTHLDLSTLTTLSICSTFHAVFDLVQRCPMLEEADLRIVECEPFNVINLKVVAAYLRSLTAHHYCLRGILRFLTASSLEEFRTHVESAAIPVCVPFPAEEFIRFIRRSQCNITILEISNYTILDSEFTKILATLPMLSHLLFHQARSPVGIGSLSDHFFHEMTLSSHPFLLPQLSHLELGIMHRVNEDLIVEMVRSRVTYSCFRSFVLAHRESVRRETFGVLSMLHGLEFSSKEQS
ncbi:hypothetical protein Moror_12330 [Moniliophthora roreri MCA 2997]|uniref:Uncharacterized protein n=1 Tax=Moniliophthora roreri (strain MCA 2997) TaxID=1381753 RepID=V2XQA4_MONRO|nr:hypothetical protein Moror_12330 [Moniliophthora roreri MCA 2997]